MEQKASCNPSTKSSYCRQPHPSSCSPWNLELYQCYWLRVHQSVCVYKTGPNREEAKWTLWYCYKSMVTVYFISATLTQISFVLVFHNRLHFTKSLHLQCFITCCKVQKHFLSNRRKPWGARLCLTLFIWLWMYPCWPIALLQFRVNLSPIHVLLKILGDL